MFAIGQVSATNAAGNTRKLIRGDRDEIVARILEESEHFKGRLKSDEARNAFMAFMQKKAK